VVTRPVCGGDEVRGQPVARGEMTEHVFSVDKVDERLGAIPKRVRANQRKCLPAGGGRLFVLRADAEVEAAGKEDPSLQVGLERLLRPEVLESLPGIVEAPDRHVRGREPGFQRAAVLRPALREGGQPPCQWRFGFGQSSAPDLRVRRRSRRPLDALIVLAQLIDRHRAFERNDRFVVSLQAGECLAALFQNLTEQVILLGKLEPEQVLADLQRFLEGAGGERAAAGEEEKSRRSARIGGRASLVEMMCQHGRMTIEGRGAQPLQDVRDPEMQPLTTRQ
jgi:hypothetical protein